MPKDLRNLTRNELGLLFPIILSAPKPKWRNLFVQEKDHLITLLGDEIVLRVEHIGSTAVPNLVAKPTIDLLVEIPKTKDVENLIIDTLTSPEYRYIHDQTKHLMFVKGYTPKGFMGQCYHIHMGPKDDTDLWDQIYFRDYLILNPAVANEYVILKKELASKYTNDRDAYTEAKTDFIKDTTEMAKKHYGIN